ncbi:MAG: small multi-drug export protein [Candidatus Omnitrophica bacterium]|nr:small multi-drug export protein [Candidatus Omnitrophota bacterium]
MLEQLIYFVKGLQKELITVAVAALPISELRGAMPLAVAMGISLKKAFFLSVIGNMLPIIPILIFLEPVSAKLRRFKILARFFDWFFTRTRKKAGVVEKFETLGLILFVAIPLPVTGAWTGCVAASLFKIRFRYAFLAISLGVLIAGIIVAALISIGKVLV